MSILKLFKFIKIKYFLMISIFKNESITINNIYILKNIFKRQFKLKKNNLIFNLIIYLIYENLKMWLKI